MFAVAFGPVVADTEQHHPKGVSQAYADIGSILMAHGFERAQGSLYITMAKLFLAVQALRTLEWFPMSVKDIRAFRMEQWSDFTPVVKA